jgi:hypothetical protein
VAAQAADQEVRRREHDADERDEHDHRDERHSHDDQEDEQRRADQQTEERQTTSAIDAACSSSSTGEAGGSVWRSCGRVTGDEVCMPSAWCVCGALTSGVVPRPVPSPARRAPGARRPAG